MRKEKGDEKEREVEQCEAERVLTVAAILFVFMAKISTNLPASCKG